ncbi:hypothetical protein CU100_14575 [Phyllobacterium endophyticum]|uniref:Uncharacterized protein n=1 Tax=Phyllobacterium endophyticum TaxID=1149773 RepID=A0A2P7AQY9_9HYPH|nr:hypothetical protein CU100_14575 [Phyllobacterium endophyticum]
MNPFKSKATAGLGQARLYLDGADRHAAAVFFVGLLLFHLFFLLLRLCIAEWIRAQTVFILSAFILQA